MCFLAACGARRARHDPSQNERWFAGRLSQVAHAFGVGRGARGAVPEEILVAEPAEPAEDVLGLEHEDPGAQAHRERELLQVQGEGRLAAGVEEAVVVAADLAALLAVQQLFDRLYVAGLEPPHRRVVETEAELEEEPLQRRGDHRRMGDRLRVSATSSKAEVPSPVLATPGSTDDRSFGPGVVRAARSADELSVITGASRSKQRKRSPTFANGT